MTTKTRTQKLHFVIDGEWLTDHCRNLWTEGRQDFAIRTLVKGLQGMNEGYATLICTGKKKLIGRSDDEISMVNDDTTVHHGMKLLSAEESLQEKDKKIKHAKDELRREISPTDYPYEPKGDILPTHLEPVPVEEERPKALKLEDFLLKNKHWWKEHSMFIWPDGKCYNVRKFGYPFSHLKFCDYLDLDEKEVETFAIKISGRDIIPAIKERLTKAQKEKVAEYCTKNKLRFPSFWDEY